MLLKLLKLAKATPGSAVRDSRTGFAVKLDADNVIVTKHGERKLTVVARRVTFTQIDSKAELKAFQSVLDALEIPVVLGMGDFKYDLNG